MLDRSFHRVIIKSEKVKEGWCETMARLSDIIEAMLKEMIDDNNGSVEITRGELAEHFNCVPSQITYVLSTRFTNGQGYMVESRRGGGGWIRIHRLMNYDDPSTYVMHVLNAIGEELSQHQAEIFIRNFVDYQILDKARARLMRAAVSDHSLSLVATDIRDRVRMQILKQMLLQHTLDESEVSL